MTVFRLTGNFYYDCSFRLIPHTYYVLICLICTVYCVQGRTFNFSSEYASTYVFQESSSNSNNSRPKSSTGLNTVDTLGEQLSLQNGTGKTWYNTSGYRNITEGKKYLDDYAYDDYAAMEDFSLSYIGPEVVVDLGPEELVLSHEQSPPGPKRKPVVKDGFVWEQKMELLRLHNMYRSNVTPPAADMNFMEWDEYLAKAAQDWANGCRFMHAFPPYVEPGTMGQNLYMGHDPTGVRALLMWNEEFVYYNLKTLFCEPGKQCGHYTQLAWGNSKLVGCGMKRCAIRRFYVVCHYSPPGNIGGVSPYYVGKPCSQCHTSDGGLCANNMCVTKDQCDRTPDTCEYKCPLQCRNCGNLDKENCKCNCADGWDSLDCSRPCKDKHDRCGKNPGWPSVTSCPMSHHAVANLHCRKMCGKCRGVQRSNPENLCCNGTVCPDGHILEVKENSCSCNVLCPGPLCYISPDYSVQEITTVDGGTFHHAETAYRVFVFFFLTSIPLIISIYEL